MKRLLLNLIVITAILIPTAVLASDITDAKFYGVITVTNDGTATSDVFTTFIASSQALIDSGFVNDSFNNSAVHNTAGADVAYMPSVNATVPWSIYVESIGSSAQQNYLLYTGGAIDMDGRLRYFPGIAGMLTVDSAAIELSDNFTIETEGWIQTTFTDNYTDRDIYDKPEAFKIFVVSSGNITASIAEWISPSSNDGAAGWNNPDNAHDENESTNADVAVALNVWSSYLELTPTLPLVACEDVKILVDTVTPEPDNKIEIDVYYSGGWNNISSSGAPGSKDWVSANIGSVEVVSNMRVRYFNGAAAGGSLKLYDSYLYDYESPLVSATGVSSDNHTLRVTYLPNLLLNGNFENGNPPNNWARTGAGSSISRVSNPVYVDTYSANLTRNGADCYAEQTAMTNAFMGREITVGAWVYATSANQTRVQILDGLGLGSTESSFHTGNSAWEWLTITRIVAPGADRIRARIRVDNINGSAFFDGLILVEGDAIPDFNTVRIFIDDVEKDQVYTEVKVPDNSANMTAFRNFVMPYVHYFKLWKSEIN